MRRAPTSTLLRGVLLGLLVAGVSIGVLAMHQVPHTVSLAQQHHCAPHGDAPGPADPVTHMCAGVIVVVAGLGALALVALVRREPVVLPRPSLLRWHRRLSGRAPPVRLKLAELCVLRL
ncbi:hypothetical protein NLX83_03505 [Allokutzneria sp. A3M-2-11 16]|uniref:hypothetical protein n=1 Tax=Allokutzneria sp. A3M-2-11 16 TaxID=2962043 RepID=UPI0020B750C2|nr:hypothetical protein [Allokutzneria sp. A3M-2-11 16]MCP3798317.1 hypothetical protein [Allokutzneria sp. A3M-2-11 16]